MNKPAPISMTKREAKAGTVFFFLQLFVLPVLLRELNGLLPTPLSAGILNASFSLLCFVCVLVIFRKYLADSLRQFVKRPVPVLLYTLLGLLSYYLTGLLMAFALQKLAPGFFNVNDQHIMQNIDGWISVLTIVLLTPFSEEVLYRGLLFDRIAPHSAAAAYAVSTLIFCMIHVAGYIGGYPVQTLLLSFIQYIPGALCLGFIYRRSGSLLAPVLMHICINLTGMFLLR